MSPLISFTLCDTKTPDGSLVASIISGLSSHYVYRQHRIKHNRNSVTRNKFMIEAKLDSTATTNLTTRSQDVVISLFGLTYTPLLHKDLCLHLTGLFLSMVLETRLFQREPILQSQLSALRTVKFQRKTGCDSCGSNVQ